MEPSSSIDIADGEAVEISWEVKNNPESCEAQGSWSGQKSDQGNETTEGLYGPQNLTFSLYCKNAVGEDKKTVEVNVAGPGQKYARSDRPDEKSKEQVKVVYILPKDQESRDLDLLGENQGGILHDVNKFQEWFKSQTSGSHFRMDTYGNNKLDITRLRLEEKSEDLEGLDYTTLSPVLVKRLEKAGFRKSHKKYLVYYDGPNLPQSGSGGGKYAFIYIRQEYYDRPPADMAVEATAVHELAHTMSVVDDNAPNSRPDSPAHVSEPCPRIIKDGTISDLMCASGGGKYSDVGDVKQLPTLDYGRDDYYNDTNDEGNLPSNVTNLADSPWIIHP